MGYNSRREVERCFRCLLACCGVWSWGIRSVFNSNGPDFLLKNPDFLLKHDDFLLKNDDFLLKNDDFIGSYSVAIGRKVSTQTRDGAKIMNSAVKTRNFALQTRNCVSKTRNCAFKSLNSLAGAMCLGDSSDNSLRATTANGFYSRFAGGYKWASVDLKWWNLCVFKKDGLCVCWNGGLCKAFLRRWCHYRCWAGGGIRGVVRGFVLNPDDLCAKTDGFCAKIDEFCV